MIGTSTEVAPLLVITMFPPVCDAAIVFAVLAVPGTWLAAHVPWSARMVAMAPIVGCWYGAVALKYVWYFANNGFNAE